MFNDRLVKWDEGTEVVANANDGLEWTKAHLGIKYICSKVAINNLSKIIERWW